MTSKSCQKCRNLFEQKAESFFVCLENCITVIWPSSENFKADWGGVGMYCSPPIYQDNPNVSENEKDGSFSLTYTSMNPSTEPQSSPIISVLACKTITSW